MTRFITHAEGVERSLAFLASPAVQDTLPVRTLAHVTTVTAELRRAQDQLADAVRAGNEMNESLALLMGLCPCPTAAEDERSQEPGPRQGCPIHGDGETFVAYVKALEAVHVAALEHLLVSDSDDAPTEWRALDDALDSDALDGA
jgi:hypothetical protein